MTTILETKNLVYNYPDGTEALKGIDFKLEENILSYSLLFTQI